MIKMVYVNCNFNKSEIRRLDDLKFKLKKTSREETIKKIVNEYFKLVQKENKDERI